MKPAFLLMIRRTPISTLFTYTTLFRSSRPGDHKNAVAKESFLPQSPLRETNYANLDFCKMKPALPHSNKISSLRTDRKLGAQEYGRAPGRERVEISEVAVSSQKKLRETNYANLDFCKMKPALPNSNQISSLRTDRKMGA